MSEIKVIKVMRSSELLGHDHLQEADEPREEARVMLRQMVSKVTGVPCEVTYEVGDRTTIFHVECDKEGLGRLIGAKGKNIGAVRVIIAAVMAISNIRAVVEIPYFPADHK